MLWLGSGHPLRKGLPLARLPHCVQGDEPGAVSHMRLPARPRTPCTRVPHRREGSSPCPSQIHRSGVRAGGVCAPLVALPFLEGVTFLPPGVAAPACGALLSCSLQGSMRCACIARG